MAEDAKSRGTATPLATYLQTLVGTDVTRVAGTAVYLSIDPQAVPSALLGNLAHNKVLHRQLLFVKVTTRDTPFVDERERVSSSTIARDSFRVEVTYGFKDDVDLPRSLQRCALFGGDFDPAKASYFLSRTTVVPTPGSGMWLWREKLFASMVQNVGSLAVSLKLPAERVVELGTQVDI